MKKLFLLIAVSFATYLNAQTTIGKIAPMGAFVAELSYTSNGADTVYTFSFNDKTYTKIDAIKVISFKDLNTLYNKIKSVFKKEKDNIETFDLGKYSVTIKKTKSMGITSVMILIDGAYTTLTEKQVDKLFGR